MREVVLKRFFEGSASEGDLALDLQSALISEGPTMTKHPIVDMSGEFEVQPSHLVKVCDAVLSGVIQPASLKAIGFCLIASDAFYWDSDSAEGQRVANVAFDWSSPEINHALTKGNVAAWRSSLLGNDARFETM
jgi:hypothetical protein